MSVLLTWQICSWRMVYFHRSSSTIYNGN